MTTRAPAHPVGVGGQTLKVVRLKHPGRWIASAVALVLAAMLVNTLITNKNFQWDVVAKYFTSKSVLSGLGRTLELTALAMLIGIVLGVVLALMRLSGSPVLKSIAGLYVWVFRGTPLLVQLILLYNISALYPKLSLGIPFGPEFVSGNVNTIITPYVVALAALALNEAAFMSEIIRGGILSVEPGQVEAAQALGMRRNRITRRVVLPQAMRFIIPPTGNQVISMLKATSLVSVIALPELLYSTQVIYTRTYQTIPLLIVATLWYLIVTSVLMVGQGFLERRYSRGSRSSGATIQGPTMLRRLTGLNWRSARTAVADQPPLTPEGRSR